MHDDLTARRKDAHLDLCATDEVEPAANRTLFDEVRLAHCALPDLSVDEIDLSTAFLGKRLRAPLMITGMTGGTDRAGVVNRELAAVAETHGVAFGVGSQRAMLDDSARAASYLVRDVAPTVALVGNIGLTQAVKLGLDGVLKLREAIDADGMAIHLNVGQELTQPEGDRDFRGGSAVIERLARVLGDRLIIKETGCGLSPSVVRHLGELGVRTLDVSGLGGTSWIRVEQLRAQGTARAVGETFASWGIPTAAATLLARRAAPPDTQIIASGGLRNGLEAAKAMALGADLAGVALPIFRAHQAAGAAGAEQALLQLREELLHALLLTGSRTPGQLRHQPKVLLGELLEWVRQS